MRRRTATPSASSHRNRLHPRRLSVNDVTMMRSTSKMKQQERNWLDLPSDVTTNILIKIGIVDILENVQKVCTDWHKICKDPAFWRIINMKDIPSSVTELRNKKGLPNLITAEMMCKDAVDRSQGRLVDLTLYHDYDGVVFQYAVDRSSQLRRLEMACSLWSRNFTTDACMKFPLLEELNLYFVDISKEEIESLGRCCPLLKTLKVNEGACASDSESEDEFLDSRLNELAIAIGENLVELRHLELIANSMTNNGLKVILDNCHHLETLDLRSCFNINLDGDLGKKCVKKIKHLKLPNDSLEGCPYYELDSDSSDDDDCDLSEDSE